MKKHRVPRVAKEIALLTLLCIVTACSEPVTEKEERLRTVKYVVVGDGLDNDAVEVFTGTMQAAQEARLSFNVGGTVEEIYVAVGDTVRPGGLVARLDAATYDVEVELERASLAIAEAERRSAESEYQRVRQLYANDNASQTELESALSRADSARASSKASEQSLQLARLNRQYTELRSDEQCTVGSIAVEERENVSAGATVATVNCGDRWEVEIGVPESQISNFRVGLPGDAQLDAIPSGQFNGVVIEVGVSGSGSTFPVVFQLFQSHVSMRSGLAATVTFSSAKVDVADGVFTLPSTAIGQDERGLFVFVLENEDGDQHAQLKRRSVNVGGIVESGIEVTAGVKRGDHVLTAGLTIARDGLRVLAPQAQQ